MGKATEARRRQSDAFADQLGVDRDELARAADAVWSTLNPDSHAFTQALSLAGVAVRAAKDGRHHRVRGDDVRGDRTFATHDGNTFRATILYEHTNSGGLPNGIVRVKITDPGNTAHVNGDRVDVGLAAVVDERVELFGDPVQCDGCDGTGWVTPARAAENRAADVGDTFHLVYQGGIANVFKGNGDDRRRVLQGAFGECEMLVRGAQAAGAEIAVWHANVAGDVASAEWTLGKGGPFEDKQRPPAAGKR